MKKIYFIDNNLRKTCKVIEALRGYYQDRVNDTLYSTMILVNIDGKDKREEIEYYKKIFSEINTTLKHCVCMEDIENEIENINRENVVVMVDLHMAENEEKKVIENPEYQFISMRCMDKLEKEKIPYVWYSSYAGDKFKDQWQASYQRRYNRDIPTIYERNDLIQAHFKVAAAKEILGV